MSFTLGDVKAAVQALGYGSDSTSAQTQMAKMVLRRLYGSRRWEFIEAETTIAGGLAAGSTSATIGVANLLHVDAVRLRPAGATTPTSELEFHDRQVVRAAQLAAGSERDTPARWAQTSTAKLQFDCPADLAYDVIVDYVALPTLPAADGDTITWPDAYMDVIVWGVAKQLAHRQRDWSASATADADYTLRLHEMAGEYAIEQRQTSRQVEHWSGWED